MVKADDKVDYGDGEKEKYTNFEVLQKRVEILQKVIDEHASILRQNKLVKKEESEASFFDEDRVFKELENEVTGNSSPE